MEVGFSLSNADWLLISIIFVGCAKKQKTVYLKGSTDLWAFSEDTIIAIGYGLSRLINTKDGGENWDTLWSDGLASFMSIVFLDRNHGFMAGSRIVKKISAAPHFKYRLKYTQPQKHLLPYLPM